MRRSLLSAALVAVLAGCSTPQAGPPTPTPAPASSAPAAEAPGAYQGRWWSWAAAEPDATNPVVDDTGRDCARNQPADEWFLAGTFGGTARRTCRVPADRKIVAPLVNLATGEPRDCADFMTDVSGSAVLDDQKLKAERRAGDAVVVEAVAGNALGWDAGVWDATACGLWVRFGPLAAGEHRLRIRGTAVGLRVAVDYTLRVEAP